jgi:(p)ppGpp synthase/HD superfamily hydrolase
MVENIVKDGERIAAALTLIVRAHGGQFDKSGKPYVEHAARVGAACAWHSIDAMLVGLLHDTVEDTDVTLEDIEHQFGHTIARAVDAITHRTGESYDDYMERLIKNGLARIAKLQDLRDNSAPERRFDGPRYGELMRRYEKSMDRLIKIDGWMTPNGGR